jgi:hypothetical protein
MSEFPSLTLTLEAALNTLTHVHGRFVGIVVAALAKPRMVTINQAERQVWGQTHQRPVYDELVAGDLLAANNNTREQGVLRRNKELTEAEFVALRYIFTQSMLAKPADDDRADGMQLSLGNEDIAIVLTLILDPRYYEVGDQAVERGLVLPRGILEAMERKGYVSYRELDNGWVDFIRVFSDSFKIDWIELIRLADQQPSRSVTTEQYIPLLLWFIRTEPESVHTTLPQFFRSKNRSLAQAAIEVYSRLADDGRWLLQVLEDISMPSEMLELLELVKHFPEVEFAFTRRAVTKMQTNFFIDLEGNNKEQEAWKWADAEVKMRSWILEARSPKKHSAHYREPFPLLSQDPVIAWWWGEQGYPLDSFEVEPWDTTQVREYFGTDEWTEVYLERLSERRYQLLENIRQAILTHDLTFLAGLLDVSTGARVLEDGLLGFDGNHGYTQEERLLINKALQALADEETDPDQVGDFALDLELHRQRFLADPTGEHDFMRPAFRQSHFWYAFKAGLAGQIDDLKLILTSGGSSPNYSTKTEAIRWLGQFALSGSQVRRQECIELLRAELLQESQLHTHPARSTTKESQAAHYRGLLKQLLMVLDTEHTDYYWQELTGRLAGDKDNEE